MRNVTGLHRITKISSEKNSFKTFMLYLPTCPQVKLLICPVVQLNTLRPEELKSKTN